MEYKYKYKYLKYSIKNNKKDLIHGGEENVKDLAQQLFVEGEEILKQLQQFECIYTDEEIKHIVTMVNTINAILSNDTYTHTLNKDWFVNNKNHYDTIKKVLQKKQEQYQKIENIYKSAKEILYEIIKYQ